MKQSFILLCVTLLSVTSVWSQKAGFYGKKAFIEFSGTGAAPLINNWYNGDFNYFEKSGSGVVYAKDRFNGGFQGGVGIVLKQDVAFGFTTGLFYSNAPGPQTLYYYDPIDDEFNGVNVKHENLKIRSLTFMPTLHFTFDKSAILPAGLTHEIGFGFVRTKVIESDYAFQGAHDNYYNNLNYNGNSYDLNEFMDSVYAESGEHFDYNQSYNGYTFMYGFKMRTPIGKQLMINYGIRYTLNLASKKQVFDFSNTIDSYETALTYQIVDNVRITRLRSICSLQVGLTYLF
ncbi:MAG: hypothetical protein V4604_13090 [Bacteroidota bacterium]